MSSLTLQPISLGRISTGGYSIRYEGVVAPKTTLLLAVPDIHHALDVTDRSAKDLLGPKNLPVFLSLIGKQKAWGTKGRCSLIVQRGGVIVAQSNEQTFLCPVRPYVGPLRPELGRGDGGPPLTYTGIQTGRMLHMPAIDGCYYFAFGNQFETDNSQRGLNCITYAGAVFGIDARTGAMSAYGTQLAQHCGCSPCDMENKTLAEVRAFFAKNRVGTYLMWSAGHTVIVVNGTVHEFRQLKGGYNVQPTSLWNHSDSRWWVRRTAKQF